METKNETQQEKFNKFKDQINKILEKIEKEYNIYIFFACETGSRALGTDVENSDFDISGFFVAKTENYFQLFPKYDKTIKVVQQDIEVNGKKHEIDIDLLDFKEYLRDKCVKNDCKNDYWFTSPVCYRGSGILNKELTVLKPHLFAPTLIYFGKAKSGIVYNEKDIKSKANCNNKSLMNVITSMLQYLHVRIFNDFPIYNIFEEIEFIKANQNKILETNTLTENEIKTLLHIIEVYLDLYQQKLKDRMSTSNAIPKAIYDMNTIIMEKFSSDKIRADREPLKEEIAQQVFDDMLKQAENYIK